MSREKILVLDFGSQYAHLIAKRFRTLGYYSEIALPSISIHDNKLKNVKGIVFSGGPASIYEKNIPSFNKKILTLDIPILGLCYGHYIVNTEYGGKVQKAKTGEFGLAEFSLNEKIKCPLFKNISPVQQVWMSHQDEVVLPSEGFETIGSTANCKYAALQNLSKKHFSFQFHCEVKDTPCGEQIFKNFAEFCKMEQNWNQNTVLNKIIKNIKEQAKNKKVLLFLSGGVDSTITFALLNKALGQDRVLGLHIDNGFMRKNESKNVAKSYRTAGFNNFIAEDASDSFLKAVENLTDPQQKRHAVGSTFISVRDKVVNSQKLDENEWLLAQGTLYPDIIESGGTENSKTIKTHHNRVKGIQELIEKGLIIEPVKELYKDEVRNIGKQLGLDEKLIMRHPFPGPGLSINVLCSTGSLSKNDEDDLKKAENEFRLLSLPVNNIKKEEILPVRSVGVQGDFRTYNFPAVISLGTAENGIYYNLPENWKYIEETSSFITNNSKNINRTVLLLFKKNKEKLNLQKGFCTKDRLDYLREADEIVLNELHRSGWYSKIFQHLTISLPYACSESTCSFVLRPVCSEDVMTARFAHLPLEILTSIVKKISALPFTDAIYFDCTNKPPATFGWE